MIKTENEYQECLKRLQKDREFMIAQRKALKEAGLGKDEIERALEPSRSFNEQLNEEVEWYEHVKRRNFDPVRNLSGIGRLLIGLRIANGMSQAELARKLNVDESQVSRDERNEYHGVTVDRAQKILSAMEEHVVLNVEDKGMAIA